MVMFLLADWARWVVSFWWENHCLVGSHKEQYDLEFVRNACRLAITVNPNTMEHAFGVFCCGKKRENYSTADANTGRQARG